MSNEITAYFKGTSGVSESVYQYDYGMLLIIDGPDLTAPFEVHFEHTGGVDAVTAIGQDNRVAIPNACLALPGRVTAYIYDHTGQHDGQTAYVVRFQVMNRARPVDEVTDEQDSAISKAIALLAEPIDNMETIVNEALAFTGPALADLQAADALQTARMDTFTHLPSGSTAGDAELTDIRVSADGVTYGSAGTAVRNQFTGLKSNLIFSDIGNAFDGLLSNSYWSESGVLTPYNGDVCNTNKIPCNEGDPIKIMTIPTISDAITYVSFFDSSGTTRIKRESKTGTDYEGIAPDGAKFVCFTFEKAYLIKESFNSVFVYVNNAIHRLNSETKFIAESVRELFAVDIYTPIIRNGSASNPSNPTVVNTHDFIPCGFGDAVTINVSKAPNATGGYYSFGVSFYNSSKTMFMSNDYGKIADLNKKIEIADKRAAFLKFTIAEVTEDGTAYTALRERDFTASDVQIIIEPSGSISNRINNLEQNENGRRIASDEIVQGTYDGYGQLTPSNTRIRPRNPLKVSNGQTLEFVGGVYSHDMLYGSFNKEGTFISDSAWLQGKATVYIDWDGYIVPIFRKADNSSITPNDYDALLTLIDPDTKADARITSSALANARHIQSHASEPLTLFHFSDIHADTSALSRLMGYAERHAASIDDIICTGDIVANTAVPISSWWDKRVLTCIGNHDAASYSAQTGYDWDALSMADRVAYYIAPFESNWGIIREAGKSYYYKDYPTQKVRLIVMDSQSYLVDGEEAAAQTAWLVNLLSNAVLNNIHVLIAIHGPYNDADVVNCSFSKYGRQKMVHLNDSFTPQAVVDAVSNSISVGLKFIGYIVGHNHQDYIYKPTERQLGFCVTCAAVSYAPQWYDSDQRRSSTLDAYNLVTIDTTNTLVKIIRGGGADIDNKMRTRKGICFNYSTGEKIGEIL